MDKRDLLNRLRTTRGHVAALADMMEHDAPCPEVLRQVQAVRGALRAINREALRAYLLDEECGVQAKDSDTRALAWRRLRQLLGGSIKA